MSESWFRTKWHTNDQMSPMLFDRMRLQRSSHPIWQSVPHPWRVVHDLCVWPRQCQLFQTNLSTAGRLSVRVHTPWSVLPRLSGLWRSGARRKMESVPMSGVCLPGRQVFQTIQIHYTYESVSLFKVILESMIKNLASELMKVKMVFPELTEFLKASR